MRFHTRLAVLCLSAGFGAGAFGQASQTTNAATGVATNALTPEAEQRAREILNQTLQQTPAPRAPVPDSRAQEREAARKRAEAEAKRRLEEKANAKTVAPATSAQPAIDSTREQREREIQRI